MATFRGPLFIVGMPRSGTTLMRELLNQHPGINLTLAESHFIPYFVKKFGNPPAFYASTEVTRFVREFKRSAFFATMERAGYVLDEPTFVKEIDSSSWTRVFERIFRHFGAKRDSTETIWGDKTPGYIHHLSLLKSLFPDAKFLHMLRDPRDYCLSIRKSFKKSIYRAAVRWRDGVDSARRLGETLRDDYLEIHYERLLDQPVPTMTQVSSFLGIPYENRLVELASAPEAFGDAKGHREILFGNTNKYRTQLNPLETRKIEEIVSEVAMSVGYSLAKDITPKSVNSFSLWAMKVYDGLASLQHHVLVEGGVAQGAKRFFHHYRRSSWRGVGQT